MRETPLISDVSPVVFLLDDDARLLAALGRILRANGFSIRTYTSPIDFLKVHDAQTPGCLVMDLHMPKMSGLEVQRELLARGVDRPIVFITGQGDIPTTVLGMRAGAVGFLPKPVQTAELIGYVREAMKRDAASRERHREQAETSLIQLSSALAHELNQPLGAILRNTDVAELDLQTEKPDLEELRSIVADTGKAIRRAKEIIDRMRALIERRQVDMRLLKIDDVVRDVISLARVEAASREVALSYAPVPELPPVSADRVHITQVLLNLIVNAMESVQSCPVGMRRVVIQTRADISHVEVAVCDSGPGIPVASLGRIFEPLFSTKSGGLGMGLAICRTIIDAHGGRLWVENNTPGSGATFRFVLPRAREAAH